LPLEFPLNAAIGQPIVSHHLPLRVDEPTMAARGIGIAIGGFLSIGLVISTTAVRAQSANLAKPLLTSFSEWDAPPDPSTLGGPEFEIAPRPSSAAFETSSVDRPEAKDSTPDSSFADRSQPATNERGNQESALDRVTDPTSPTVNIRFRESWNWPVNESDSDNQEFQFRPTIPFQAWGRENILRVTIPYDITGEDAPGLGSVTILDLAVHKADSRRWGIGPVVRFTPANDADSETFHIGPAFGASSKDEHWTVGLLTQNFFGDNFAESRIQPILTYKFDERWAVGVGEFEFRFDWENAIWTQVPVGVELDYIADICGQKVQLFVNPQFNFADDANNSGWTIFLGLTLIVPNS
jgi:hypothetical protein